MCWQESFTCFFILLFCCECADIDLQTCIDNFNVHKDKIIRTQDSQKMGAKYLNEIDLGGREECLRLCCETENCDVFVFEEKNSGSCYLFHCGPPEDFKCKFTHHANYSSAILAINRHLPDLESQIKLTKHEQDLNKLRKSETVTTTKSTSTTMATVKSKEVLPSSVMEESKTKNLNKPEGVVHKCSRNQFECRNPSECIAIYNVCDGIPQCADGSDEGPELRCPYTLTTPIPIIQQNNPAPPQPQPQPNYQQNMPPPRLPPPQQDIYRPQQDFMRPQRPLQYENTQYVPGPVPNWNPPQQNLPPNYVPPDKNSHIFNHKENGIQVPDGQEIRQYSPDRYPPKVPNYYENYRPIQPEGWPVNGDETQFAYPAEAPKYPVKDQRPNAVPNIPAPHPAIDLKTEETSKHEQEKAAHELQQSKVTEIFQPKIRIEKPKEYPDVVAYKIDEDLKDGLAQTPGGAVLSLTLGLIITCIMALCIACRLKVKRRMRKGGKTYAHDADYLVNGMYL